MARKVLLEVGPPEEDPEMRIHIRVFFFLISASRETFFFICWHNALFIYFLVCFFLGFFISWRLITLQYCSGFCHTLTWISHGYTFKGWEKPETGKGRNPEDVISGEDPASAWPYEGHGGLWRWSPLWVCLNFRPGNWAFTLLCPPSPGSGSLKQFQ